MHGSVLGKRAAHDPDSALGTTQFRSAVALWLLFLVLLLVALACSGAPEGVEIGDNKKLMNKNPDVATNWR